MFSAGDLAKQTLNAKGAIIRVTCPYCGKSWNTTNRGSATGFVVAAANNHTSTCNKRPSTPE